MAERPALAEALTAVAVAVLSVVLAITVLGAWDADLSVPYHYDDDSNFNQMVVKGLLDNGWYQENPDLGAPFGQELYDFPVVEGDNLSVLMVAGLGFLSSDSATVMNLFFLLCFPLIALSALLVLRLMGVARALAAVLALLFALAPYRFVRGEVHLWINAYYAVPLGVWLAFATAQGHELFRRRPEGGVGPLAWASVPSLLVLVACMVIGSAHLYYAIFSLILIAFAGLLGVARGRAVRAVATAVVLCAVVAGTVVMNHLPTIDYRQTNGHNDAIGRSAEGAEQFGLKFTRLVLPVDGHRFEPLASLAERYAPTASRQLIEGPAQALGTAATVGLLWLLGVGLFSVMAPWRRPPGGPAAGTLAALTVVALITAMVGGLSSLIAHLFTEELRSWSRMSIVISFLALAGLGLLLQSFEPRLRRRLGNAGIGALLAALLLLGVLDQTTREHAPDHERTARVYADEEVFVEEIERRLPEGRPRVFQLPYMAFPEPQPAYQPLVDGYQHARAYFHSERLRWSWGAMKGRNDDWQAHAVALPAALAVPALALAGFQGVYVDRLGYADSANAIEAFMSELGATPVERRDGQIVFYDIRPHLDTILDSHSPFDLLRARTALLSPVSLFYPAGFQEERDLGTTRRRWAAQEAVIGIANPAGAARGVVFAAGFAAGPGQSGTVTLLYPDGSTERVRVTDEEERVQRRLRLPARGGAITVRSDVPYVGIHADGQPRALELVDPLVFDESLEPLATEGPQGPRLNYGTAFGLR